MDMKNLVSCFASSSLSLIVTPSMKDKRDMSRDQRNTEREDRPTVLGRFRVINVTSFTRLSQDDVELLDQSHHTALFCG